MYRLLFTTSVSIFLPCHLIWFHVFHFYRSVPLLRVTFSYFFIYLFFTTSDSNIDCDSSDVSSRASTITLLSSLIITIPGLLVIGFFGSFANRYGLKRTLVVPVLGNFIYSGCIFLSMQQWMSSYYVGILLFGSLCSGLSGEECSADYRAI